MDHKALSSCASTAARPLLSLVSLGSLTLFCSKEEA